MSKATLLIPLKSLEPWTGNVRKTNAANLAQLKASIDAHGLLQPLVVRKGENDRYLVIAGRRRLAAITELAKDAGNDNLAVLCTLDESAGDAAEISLAENVIREPMHPADQFEAFNELAEKGMPAADIAARFGVEEKVVNQRMRLAHVSPELIEEYRQGGMTLEVLQAFAVTDDQEAQEKTWANLSKWQRDNAETIRAALTKKEIKASDKKARFVTVEAYEAAGGVVRRDLFSDDLSGIILLDGKLLNKLYNEKMESTRQAFLNEGWQWVEVRNSFSRFDRNEFKELKSGPASYTKAEEEEMDSLRNKIEALENSDEDLSAEQEHELVKAEERFCELSERDGAFDPEEMKTAGVIISFDREGKVEFSRGLVKKKTSTAAPKLSGKSQPQEPSFPQDLREELTENRSFVISAALLARPDIALAAIAHDVVGQAFYSGRVVLVGAEIGGWGSIIDRAKGNAAAKLVADQKKDWLKKLPKAQSGLLDWLLKQEQKVLIELLTFCTAYSLDFSDRYGRDDQVEGGTIEETLGIDASSWFKPTVADFFGKMEAPVIIHTLQKAGVPSDTTWSKLKKGELAIIAERHLAGTGWRPDFLGGPIKPIARPAEKTPSTPTKKPAAKVKKKTAKKGGKK